MASSEKKGGGDFILESRHLVGLFLLLVVIFGIVFTLGYLLGRSQYDAKLRAVVGVPPGTDAAASSTAAKAKAHSDSEDAQLPKKNSDWDFYHSAEPAKKDEHLQAPPKPVNVSVQPAPSKPAPASAPKPAKAAKAQGGAEGPLIPKGAIMLQVAAVLHQDDALALAQALQQKKFPAFVITPTVDKYYRVQVGPYADTKSAASARQALEAKGFKSIVKR